MPILDETNVPRVIACLVCLNEETLGLSHCFLKDWLERLEEFRHVLWRDEKRYVDAESALVRQGHSSCRADAVVQWRNLFASRWPRESVTVLMGLEGVLGRTNAPLSPLR